MDDANKRNPAVHGGSINVVLEFYAVDGDALFEALRDPPSAWDQPLAKAFGEVMDPENGPLDEAGRRSRFLDGLTARFSPEPRQASVEALGALLRRFGRFVGDASIDAGGVDEFEAELEATGLAEALLRSPKLYAAWPSERPGFGFVPASELEALLDRFQELAQQEEGVLLACAGPIEDALEEVLWRGKSLATIWL
jgi:hypothetical protein